MSTKFSKKFLWGPFLILLTAATLVACGDSPTVTPAAVTATTAAASSNSTSAATDTAAASNNGASSGNTAPSGTPGAGQGRGRQGGGFGGGFNVVTGTVQSYDASNKSLTVQENSGSTQTFDAANAVISKNTTVALADLSKENLASDIVQVTGEKGSDGTYTANDLTLADAASFGNGGFPGAGANGTPGTFPGRGNGGGFNGTPGAGRRNANGTTSANGQQGAPGGNGNGNAAPQNGNGTPGANGGARGGFGGANGGNRLLLHNAALSGNTLTGTDMSGASVTVNLSNNTIITKRVSDTATDLTSGTKISVNIRPGQNNGTSSAVAITIEQ